MLSPQKKFQYNTFSSTDNFRSIDQQQSVDTKNKGSLSRQNQADYQQISSKPSLQSTNTQYSKLLKQKQLRYMMTLEKLRKSEKQLQLLKSQSENNQNDLLFFKCKLEQQFNRNQRIEAHFEMVNQIFIKYMTFAAEHLLKDSKHHLELTNTITSLRSNEEVDNIQRSLNFLTLFQQQFDLLSAAISQKTSKAQEIHNNITFSDSYFTCSGEKVVQSLNNIVLEESCDQKSKKIFSQKVIENKKVQRQRMQQVFSKNGFQVQELIDPLGKISIKSLSKFKMAQLCLKLCKKIKEKEQENVSLKSYVQQLEQTEIYSSEKIPIYTKHSEKTVKKGTLRRMTSMQQSS